MAQTFSSRYLFLKLIIFFILITGVSSKNWRPFKAQLCGFGPGNDEDISSIINTYGAAFYTFNQGIQLAWPGGVGRAICEKPLHLWDNSTGQLNDFKTHFSFTLESFPRSSSDRSCPTVNAGLAFFMSPVGFVIPEDSAGGGMGLVSAGNPSSPSGPIFVEFDPFPDVEWDSTPGPHVGININSVRSVAAAPWKNNFTDGIEEVNEAWVTYDRRSMNLRVDFTNGGIIETLNYVMDLRDHLPEWVQIGFSGATSGGKCLVKNTVSSWSFNSTDQKIKTSSTPGLRTVWVSVGSILAAIIIIVVVIIWILREYWWKNGNIRTNNIEEGIIDIEEGQRERPGFGKGLGLKRFSFDQIVAATGDFAMNNMLGAGGAGTVFKADFMNFEGVNAYAAVKRMNHRFRYSQREFNDFVTEAFMIGDHLRHRYLVKLLGFCNDPEPLLVYEYMCNGSLESRLYKDGPEVLTWVDRYKVAQDLATVIHYLLATV